MQNAEVTAKFASSQIDRLLRNLTVAIRKALRAPNAEAVHDLRVSIRRFDQTLLLFGEMLGKKSVRTGRRRLKKVLTLAGAVRNCDIADRLIAGRFRGVRKVIDSRRARALQSLAGALRRWDQKQRSSRLGDQLQVSGTGRIDLRRMSGEFIRLGARAAESSSPAALHRFRIAAKHYRYTLELLAPLIGRRKAAQQLSVMKSVQSRLGNVTDCETVRALAAEWKLGNTVERFLRKRERQQMAKFRTQWNAQFADALKGR